VSHPAYFKPTRLVDALGLLKAHGERARVLAGGTDLVLMLRRREEQAEALVDIGGLSELGGVSEESGRLRVGALCTYTEILGSALLGEKAWPVVEAAATVGGVQIRNVGTVGGNLAHASPAADLVPPLVALGAEAVVVSPDGQRTVAVEAMATGPKRTGLRTGELIREVVFEPLRTGDVGFFYKLGERGALAIAVVSLALVARPASREGSWERVRIALGAVAPTVIRALEAEEILVEGPITPERIEAAARAAARATSPIDDVRAPASYRRDMVSALLRAELERLLEAR
jgi:CO/xanthine dehydrogenase FAD-binding subunit